MTTTAPLVRPGDILLYRVTNKTGLLAALIGLGQKLIHQAPSRASYYHAALAGKGGYIYEARWPRVRKTIMVWDDNIEVYRVKGADDWQIANVLGAAEKRLGKWYDLLAILTLGYFHTGFGAVCSYFVWESCVDADIVLCPCASLESPDDIAASVKLERIK